MTEQEPQIQKIETPPQTPSNDIEEHKVIAAIGYIFILCFVPLLLAKESPFAQFHGKQALALFIIDVVVLVFNGTFGWVSIIGWFFAIVFTLLVIAFSLLGFLRALAGEQKELPFLGGLAKALKF